MRRQSVPAGPTNSASPIPPYGLLLLLLHLRNKPRFYRLSQYLSWEETRRKAKESAYGISELEAPGEDDDPDKDPEDAWCSSEVSAHHTPVTPAMEQHPLDTDVLQLFEEYAQPEQLTADQVAEELADDGLVDHFRKLANADLITRDMSLANYIQFAEVRGQATFVGHKSPSKRFMEFISPHLVAIDMVITDELVEMLGFLAHEICVELIEHSRETARRRVMLLKTQEAKLKSQKAAQLERVARLQAKRKQQHISKDLESEGVHKDPQNGTSRSRLPKKPKVAPSKTAGQVKAAEEEQARRRREEENLHPRGPFSAARNHSLSLPSSAQITGANPSGDETPDSALFGLISAPPNVGSAAADASKVDGPTAAADVTSFFDVLLGDFENALYDNARTGRLANPPKLPKTSVLNRFRR